MAKKAILIDAHSIIYRSYYAFIKNPLKNSKGNTTSGIFGFLNTLEKIKKNIGYEYMCLAYDAPGKTFRDEVYKEYKATRPPAPPDIPFQVEKVKEICHYLGITAFELKGYEADDLLATFAVKLKTHGEIYIVSSDKDLMQLVSPNVFVYDAYKNIVYTEQEVTKKFGIPPVRIGEYLALTGDSIDNIPGVPGIGPKRAAEILTKYGKFDDIIKNDKRVEGHRDTALLSYALTKLECHVPLEVTFTDIKVKKPDIEHLMPILLDLELHSYIKTLSQEMQCDIPSVHVTNVSDITPGSHIGLYPDNENNLCVCTEMNKLYTIPKKNATPLLQDAGITKIGYNLKNFVKEIPCRLPIFDIGVAAWLVDPNKRSYRLEDIILHTLNEYAVLTPPYVAQCCVRLYHKIRERLGHQEGLYWTIEAPLIEVLARMEKRGIKVDTGYLSRLGKEFTKEIEHLEERIFTLAGKKFNINSPKQLARVLFEDLKLKPVKRGKTHYSTNVEVLQQLRSQHELPSEILAFREYAKIKSTYIEPLITLVKAGRIHTTFNQTGTATGRLSSSNPNIQNIPIRSEVGRRIRKGFVAENGYLLVSADYSQIELRLLAHASKDKALVDAFIQHKDIHRHTASLVFNIPEKDIDETKRRMAKVVNYGLIYGMSDYGLAQGLDIPLEEAYTFIKKYYDLYSGVAKWRDHIISKTEETGYTVTLLGRVRPLPEIVSSNHLNREFSRRAAINTPIQGTAADLVKKAMIDVEQQLTKQGFSRGLLLSIHDELVFEIEDTRTEEARSIIHDAMVNALDLDVPIEVTIGIGHTWDEAH